MSAYENCELELMNAKLVALHSEQDKLQERVAGLEQNHIHKTEVEVPHNEASSHENCELELMNAKLVALHSEQDKLQERVAGLEQNHIHKTEVEVSHNEAGSLAVSR